MHSFIIFCMTNILMMPLIMHFSVECDPENSKGDDCKPVSKLSEIFTSTPTQQIERALKMSDGDISLATHKILTDCEGNFYLINFTISIMKRLCGQKDCLQTHKL